VDITQFRSEFSVLVVDRDATSAMSIAGSIKAVGYEQTRFYPTLQSALSMIQHEPPHVVLVEVDGFAGSLEKFLMDIKSISEEVLVILMASQKYALEGLQLVSRSLAYDSVTRPLFTALEIVQKIDRAVTQLYYQFESEQLKDYINQYGNVGGTGATVGKAFDVQNFDGFTVSRGGIPHFDEGEEEAGEESIRIDVLDEALDLLMATKDVDQSVQIFVEALSRLQKNTPVLYFKYLPSHMSLLFSQAAWIPLDRFRGIGLDLKKEKPEQHHLLFEKPQDVVSFKDLMKDVFQREKFSAFSHVSDGELKGVFAVFDEVKANPSILSLTSCLRRSFELAYKRNVTLKEKHALVLTDPLTGLNNRKQFMVRLDEEMSRSRRIFMPLSLIILDIDDFPALAEKVGTQQADSIVNTMGMIIKKTTRLNDVLARLGGCQFAALLPHTPHEGAAIKAERLRRVIETTKIPLLEGLGLGSIRVSAGVSEYPSFCSDAESLLSSADEALAVVRRTNGNRVCMASAMPGFEMDFIPVMPGDTSRFAKGSER
jgi:diguanylate cyclase (GGDEF)-like protein